MESGGKWVGEAVTPFVAALALIWSFLAQHRTLFLFSTLFVAPHLVALSKALVEGGEKGKGTELENIHKICIMQSKLV